MQQEVEQVYIDFPEHWWIQSRHDIIEILISQLEIKDCPRILDVGCTNGRLLSRLREKSHSAYGVDISEKLVKNSSKNSPVIRADAVNLPFNKNIFDIIIASDVIEHIQQEESVLNELKRVCKQKGYMLIFVPAFDWLWSSSDERDGHFRRYSKHDLTQKLQNSGFKVHRSSYWNFSTTPIGVPIKIIDQIFSQKIDGFSNSGARINKILYEVLSIENRFIKRGFNLPFGLSIFVISTPK